MKSLLDKISNLLLKISFYIYFIGNGVILPLFFNKNYHDLMEAKASFCFFISVIVNIFLLIVIVNNVINSNISFYKDPLLLCITIFCLISLFSSLISYSPLESILGSQGWYIGSYFLTTLMFSILCLRKYKFNNKKIIYLLLATIIVVLMIGITDAFELDILNLRDENYTIKYHAYISTIGNVNWFVGYLSLILPIFCGLYLNESNLKKKRIYLALSIFSIANFAFLRSDGIYLALGFLSFFVIPFIFNNLERIKRFSFLLFVYSVCLVISRLINLKMDGYSAFVREWYVIIPLLLLSFFIYFYSTSTKNSKYNKSKSKIIISIEVILLITCIVFLIQVIKGTDISWGNGRLLIWQKSFDAFKNFSIKNKIFGVGPELLYNIYSSLFDEFGFVLCSHSEPIQVLLSMGILGLLSYLSCWICIFINYFKNKESKITPFYFGIICYFAQSFVNSATTLNLVTLSLIVIFTYILKSDTQ